MKYKDFLKTLSNSNKKIVKKAVRKQKFIYSVLAIFIFIGVGLLTYPSAAAWWASVEQAKEVKAYSENIYDRDIQEIWDEAEEWNENLYNDQTPFRVNEYFNTLCVNDVKPCVIARVAVPSVNIDLPVYHSVNLDILEKGVGHIPESHLPIGGNSRHAILSAHTGLPSATMFDNLVNVEIGDIIYVNVLGETLAYKIFDSQVVDPNNLESAKILTMQPGRDLLTLITCTPYSVNSHRFVVVGERIDYEPDSDKLFDGDPAVECFWCWFIPSVGGLILLESGNIWLYYRNRRKIMNMVSAQIG